MHSSKPDPRLQSLDFNNEIFPILHSILHICLDALKYVLMGYCEIGYNYLFGIVLKTFVNNLKQSINPFYTHPRPYFLRGAF